MNLTKVFIAVPNLTGYRGVGELDISEKVDNMYYRGKGTSNLTPCGYVYRLDSKEQVILAFNKMLEENNEMKDRHYKMLMELRRLYGI